MSGVAKCNFIGVDLDAGCSADLVDATCGVVSFYNHVGESITLNLDDDPEYFMSGLVEPCRSFEQW